VKYERTADQQFSTQQLERDVQTLTQQVALEANTQFAKQMADQRAAISNIEVLCH
jgi:hypothetical protein